MSDSLREAGIRLLCEIDSWISECHSNAWDDPQRVIMRICERLAVVPALIAAPENVAQQDWQRIAWVLGMRVLQSELVLDDEETGAVWVAVRAYGLGVAPPAAAPDAAQQDYELPGMLALQHGVLSQRFPHSVDARVWAEEWMKGTPLEREQRSHDEGYMLAWFANAIMAGYDTAQMPAAHSTNAGAVSASADARDAQRFPFAIRLASPGHVLPSRTTVDIEVAGKWIILIAEAGDIFCHIIEPSGIDAAIAAAAQGSDHDNT